MVEEEEGEGLSERLGERSHGVRLVVDGGVRSRTAGQEQELLEGHQQRFEVDGWSEGGGASDIIHMTPG